jgi:hypothetical protein
LRSRRIGVVLDEVVLNDVEPLRSRLYTHDVCFGRDAFDLRLDVIDPNIHCGRSRRNWLEVSRFLVIDAHQVHSVVGNVESEAALTISLRSGSFLHAPSKGDQYHIIIGGGLVRGLVRDRAGNRGCISHDRSQSERSQENGSTVARACR